MTKPAWDASELARSALSELTEAERVSLMTELLQQVSNHNLIAGAYVAIGDHLHGLTAATASAPAGWVASQRVLSDLFALGETERSRLIVAVLQQIGDLKLIVDARNALTDHLNDLIARRYGIQREGQR